MVRALFILMVLALIFISGCGDIAGSIIDDTFGWMPGYSGSSSSSNTGNTVKNTQQNNNNNNLAIKPNTAEEMQAFCSKMPNSHYDSNQGGCVCNEGYVSEMGVCTLKSGGSTQQTQKECIFDQDCSPGGDVKSYCVNSYKKGVYRCDLRTYKCIPKKGTTAEVVDCKAEFGPEYICSNGLCVAG